ncbi:MAG: leucyl aminopeptidase family protein [Kiloniellales bacterium]
MVAHLVARRAASGVVPITPLTQIDLKAWLKDQPESRAAWIKALDFKAKPGQSCLLPGVQGALERVLFGVDGEDGPWTYAGLPTTLPPGRYRIDAALEAQAASHAALGWALGTYAFARYRKAERPLASLVTPAGTDRQAVARSARAIFLVRDLINTPAGDMGPGELAAAAEELAEGHGAKLEVLVGEELLKKNYPAIHAVGRASSRAPRLIDLRWGAKGPKVTLVGKGVCFDTGGLDLKPSSNMKLMKKDMGGAAHVLGLASMVMGAKLPLRLRVLVPAVENSVSGDAFRPLDVLQTRKGLTVEVGNTDAEGRLVLCDALAEADRDGPDLLLDFATLTGAARVALGTEVAALFTRHDPLAEVLAAAAVAEHDPLWRLPLVKSYRRHLDSRIADINNIASHSFGGAINAALFLAEFVRPETPWAHFDIMAWNVTSKPGRPEGGEAQALRAAFAVVASLADGTLKSSR